MIVSDLLRRNPVTLRIEQTISEAAGLMDRTGLGSLIVVDDEGRPVGIVTDRDLVRRVLARHRPGDCRVDSIMSTPLVTIDGESDASDLYSVFRRHAIRRLPVVHEGALIGVVGIDDLLIHMSADLADLVMPLAGELLFPQRDGAVPVAPTVV